MPLEFQRAFYIKLGRGGKWEPESIKRGLPRIGWKNVPLKLITGERWPAIRRLSPQTADFNALRRVCESSPEDVWITFHKSQLWWGRLAPSRVRQDKVSKYRRMKGKWHKANLQGHLLSLDQIPGTIAKYQAFRGTVCNVKEVETLRHLLRGEPSEAYNKLMQTLLETEKGVAAAIRQLHWKDFETLVDLVFSQSTGWRRRSRLGETMKYIDLELEEPLTHDVYQVQVKSTASRKEFKTFCEDQPSGVRRSYFVVHTPTADLSKLRHTPKCVQLIAPRDLAALVIQAGLGNWVANRIRYAGSV